MKMSMELVKYTLLDRFHQFHLDPETLPWWVFAFFDGLDYLDLHLSGTPDDEQVEPRAANEAVKFRSGGFRPNLKWMASLRRRIYWNRDPGESRGSSVEVQVEKPMKPKEAAEICFQTVSIAWGLQHSYRSMPDKA